MLARDAAVAQASILGLSHRSGASDSFSAVTCCRKATFSNTRSARRRHIARMNAGQLRRAPKSRDYRKLHLCVDAQKSPRFIAGCIACRTDRQSHLIGQS